MKIYKKLLPYYLSRALIAALFGWMIASSSGSVITGILIGLLIFAGFVYYLHSGRFIVDETHPFFPLRRDEWAKTIHYKALVAALAVGGIAYALINGLNQYSSLPEIPESLVLPAFALIYFAYSIVMDQKG